MCAEISSGIELRAQPSGWAHGGRTAAQLQLPESRCGPSVGNNRFSAAQDDLRPALQPAPRKGIVADIVMQSVIRECHLLVRIPDCDIRIGTDRDSALSRVKPVDLRWSSGRYFHELFKARPS